MTWRVAPGHYLGFSPRLAHQRLEIAGLEGLGFATPGSDKAYGAGFALGYLGELNDRFSIGLAYSSPIWFQKLDRYRDLIPEGRQNMPQVAGAGLAYRLTPAITLAADYQWINWSGEKILLSAYIHTLTLCETAAVPGFAGKMARLAGLSILSSNIDKFMVKYWQ